MKNMRRHLAFALVALALVVLAGWVVLTAKPVPVSLAAAPTPVTGEVSGTNSKYPVIFWYREVITQSGASNAYVLANYELLDLHYIIDMTEVNTTTLKLQFSNDIGAQSWADGVNIVANAVADANAMQQFNNFGMYTRVYATLGNSEPVTVTVIGVAK